MQTAGAKRSPTWTAVRLFAELVAFAGLLFVTRFIARGHLAVQPDEECYIGGIAVDVLAHGIRFPLQVYVQSAYDNASFLSGLLAAASFLLLGRSLLALKLVAHLIAAIGAVATLSLLRRCLDELGVVTRRLRWTATTALVIAIAVAPCVVTLPAMCTVGIGAPLEGSVIGILLLALFSSRLDTQSWKWTAACWALVGIGLYANKATLPVIPVLGLAEVVLSWRSPGRLAAAAGGFVLGVLPELLITARGHGAGWSQLTQKLERHVQAFPHAFFDSVFTLAEYRIELVLAWILTLGVGTALLCRAWIQFRRVTPSGEPSSHSMTGVNVPPFTFSLVVCVTWVHIAVLVLMAQGGFDYYPIYGYPTLAVLFAVVVAWICTQATARWGSATGAGVCAAVIATTLILYRPDATTWGFAMVSSLWRNRAGAACSFRFAAGFQRELQSRLIAPGRTQIFYLIERCRSLSEQEQVLDCIGGIARELRHAYEGTVNGEPPPQLNPVERRAYAYYHGIRRNGDMTPCNDFTNPDLRADCVAAVQLECLVGSGWGTRLLSSPDSHSLRCTVPEPPMDGYWAAARRNLLAGTIARISHSTDGFGQDDAFPACKPVYDACR